MSDNTFQTKEFKENLHKYEEARTTGSSVYLEPEEFTDIAEYYHLHGRLNDALEAIDTALAIFPGSTEPLSFRARVAILLGHNAKEAMEYANMISDKHDLDYYYIVAEIMIADNRVDDAEAYLEEKEKDVDDDDLEDYYLDVANLFADYDVYDMAQMWVSKCSDTDDEDYQEIMGRIAMNQGKYKKSARIFNKLLDRDPYRTGYWNLLASTQYLSNDIKSSIESSEFSLAIDPDDTDALLNKANGLIMLGNTREAIKCYERYRQLQPQSEVADMGIAAAMMSENKPDEALKHWKKAATLCAPNSVNKIDIYRNLCLVYASLGQFDNAFKAVDKLEALTSGPSSDTNVMRGYLALLVRNQHLAEDYFREAYSDAADEDKNNVLFYIAYCYFDCSYMQQAHDIFRLLTKGDNSNFIDLWAYLVRTDYELKLQDEFLNDLKEATKRNPSGLQRELSDVFPKGMAVRDFYDYAVQHPIN